MFTSVVLAGERAGVNEFGAQFGVAAKVLVPVAGVASLTRVLNSLRASAQVSGGIVAGPAEDVANTDATCRTLFEPGDFCWMAPAHGPAASALAATNMLGDYPILLTSGDHALLTPAIIDEFCAEAARSDYDLVVGLVAHDVVQAAYPGVKRTVHRFSDGHYCGSNLYALTNPRACEGLRFWQHIESLRKSPRKIIGRMGFITLARYVLGGLNIDAAFKALSKRAGCRVGFVRVAHPRAAVDVDSVADWRLAESVLADAEAVIG